MHVYCDHSYSCVFSPRPVTGSFTCTSKNHTNNFFTIDIHAVLLKDNVALLVTFYSYRIRTLTRLQPKMHLTQVLKATHNLCLVYNENTHLQYLKAVVRARAATVLAVPLLFNLSIAKLCILFCDITIQF